MSKERIQSGQGRQRVPFEKATAIQARLSKYVNERYPSRSAFADSIGVPRTTVTGWFSQSPRTPETPHLLKLAASSKISLNWLLLGEGSEVQPELAPWDDLALKVQKRLDRELEERYGLSGLGTSAFRLLDTSKAFNDVVKRYAEIVFMTHQVFEVLLTLEQEARTSKRPFRFGSLPLREQPPLRENDHSEKKSELDRRFEEEYKAVSRRHGD